jgi:hypothetical protein
MKIAVRVAPVSADRGESSRSASRSADPMRTGTMIAL